MVAFMHTGTRLTAGYRYTTLGDATRSGRECGCLSAMSTSQDYPNSTPTPATTTTGEGQGRGPSLRDISQQELNTATQYMIDEHGYAAH